MSDINVAALSERIKKRLDGSSTSTTQTQPTTSSNELRDSFKNITQKYSAPVFSTPMPTAQPAKQPEPVVLPTATTTAQQAPSKIKNIMLQIGDVALGTNPITMPFWSKYRTGKEQTVLGLAEQATEPYVSGPIKRFANEKLGGTIDTIAEKTSNTGIKLAARGSATRGDTGTDKKGMWEFTGDLILGAATLTPAGGAVNSFAKMRSNYDELYKTAYEAYMADRQDPNNKLFESTLWALQDSGPQSLYGLAITAGVFYATKNPKLSLAASMPYWSVLSASEQRQEKGEIYSLENIAIDTVGDTILGATLEGLLRHVGKNVVQRAGSAFLVEGGTEISQTLLKLGNDYRNAKTEEERKAILEEAKQYVVSGEILTEGLVGGLVGGVASLATEVGAPKGMEVNEKTGTPKEDKKQASGGTPPKGGTPQIEAPNIEKLADIIAADQRGEETGVDPDQMIDVRTAFNDYATLFNTRVIYSPATPDMPVTIEASVVPVGEKFALKYSADMTGAGLQVDYDLNNTYKTAEAATKAAKAAIQEWARTELKTNTQLDTAARSTLEAVAKAEKKEKTPDVPVKRRETPAPAPKPPQVDTGAKVDPKLIQATKKKGATWTIPDPITTVFGSTIQPPAYNKAAKNSSKWDKAYDQMLIDEAILQAKIIDNPFTDASVRRITGKTSQETTFKGMKAGNLTASDYASLNLFLFGTTDPAILTYNSMQQERAVSTVAKNATTQSVEKVAGPQEKKDVLPSTKKKAESTKELFPPLIPKSRFTKSGQQKGFGEIRAGKKTTMTVYRGTKTDEGLLESKDIDFGPGYYFAEGKEDAAAYGEVVKQYEVTLDRPLVLPTRYEMNRVWDTFLQEKKNDKQTIRDYLKEMGFDGIIIEEPSMGYDETWSRWVVAFDSKSVTPKLETDADRIRNSTTDAAWVDALEKKYGDTLILTHNTDVSTAEEIRKNGFDNAATRNGDGQIFFLLGTEKKNRVGGNAFVQVRVPKKAYKRIYADPGTYREGRAETLEGDEMENEMRAAIAEQGFDGADVQIDALDIMSDWIVPEQTSSKTEPVTSNLKKAETAEEQAATIQKEDPVKAATMRTNAKRLTIVPDTLEEDVQIYLEDVKADLKKKLESFPSVTARGEIADIYINDKGEFTAKFKDGSTLDVYTFAKMLTPEQVGGDIAKATKKTIDGYRAAFNTARREGALKKKRTIFGDKKRPETLVGKTPLKDILMGEDRIVFDVMVRGDRKYLHYVKWRDIPASERKPGQGEREVVSEMTIRPSALGLIGETLEDFQEVVLDATELKKKGTFYKLVDSEGNTWAEPAIQNAQKNSGFLPGVSKMRGLKIGDEVRITQKNGKGKPVYAIVSGFGNTEAVGGDYVYADPDSAPLFGAKIYSFASKNIEKVTLTEEQRAAIEAERSRVPITFGNMDEYAQAVYHGGPHKWDKPDLSKVGTGEGAQAYGWGFYVTEVEGIGRDYQQRLSQGDEAGIFDDTRIGGKRVEDFVAGNLHSREKNILRGMTLQYGATKISAFGDASANKDADAHLYLVGALTSTSEQLKKNREYMAGRREILEKEYGDPTSDEAVNAIISDYEAYLNKFDQKYEITRFYDNARMASTDSIKEFISGTYGLSIDKKIGLLAEEEAANKKLEDVIDAAIGKITAKNTKMLRDHTGYLYELEINDDATKTYLQWDEPMNKQPKVVQDAWDAYVQQFNRSKVAYNKSAGWKGHEMYSDLVNARLANPLERTGDPNGEWLGRNDEGASKWLLEHGVRGIKYLTGDTRNKNKWMVTSNGTSPLYFDTKEEAQEFLKTAASSWKLSPPKADYNYVVFDTSDITVIARNGERLQIVEEQDGGADGEFAEEVQKQRTSYENKVIRVEDIRRALDSTKTGSAYVKTAERTAMFERFILPKLKKLRALREGEQVIFYLPAKNDATGIQYVNRDLERIWYEQVDSTYEVVIAKDEELLSTGVKEKDAVGEALYVPNDDLWAPTKSQPRDPVTQQYRSYDEVESEIEELYEKISDRVMRAESDTGRPSRFLERTPDGDLPYGNLSANEKALEQNSSIEYEKLVRRSMIARKLSQKLNAVVRRGKMRQQALGVYKPKQGVVRLSTKLFAEHRLGGQLTTLFHELGHFLDFTTQRFRTLVPMSERPGLLAEYGGGYESVPKNKRGAEAFAEFLRYYLTDPAKAKDIAPQFNEIFENTMKGYPEINEALLEAQRDFKRWAEQPAEARQAARISYPEYEEKKGMFSDIGQSARKAYTMGVDRVHPLHNYTAFARQVLGLKNINATEDPGILAQNLNGWIGQARYFLEFGTIKRGYWKKVGQKGFKVEKTGKSLKEILQPIDKRDALKDFSLYLVSRRDIELEKRGIATGATPGDAKKTIESMEARHPDFKQAAEDIDKYQTSLLEMLVEYGVLSTDQYHQIKALNKQYVPFYRVLEEMESSGFMGGKKIKGSNPVKKIKGAELDIIDPIESIIKNTYTLVYAARQNEVLQAMAKLAKKHHKLGQLFEQVPVDQTKVASVNAQDIVYQALGATSEFDKMMLPIEVKKAIDIVVPDTLVNIFRPAFLQKGNIVTVLHNGKPSYYYADQDIYEAIEGMNIDQAGFWLNMMSYPAQWLRAGATLTPEFMLRNPLRDTMAAGIQSRNNFIPVVDTLRGLASVLKADEYYQAWLIEGGELASLVAQDRRQMEKNQRELLRRSERIKKTIVNPLEALKILSSLTEQATRVGEAKRALRKGKSPTQATNDSREVSSDFLRMGSKTIPISRIAAFWNAQIQGVDKTVRSFKERPVQSTAKAISMITIPSIILYLLNRDEDGWDEIPQWQKDLFWLVKLPDGSTDKGFLTYSDNKGVWLRIPKPFELGYIFGSLPERLLEYIDKKDPEKLRELERTIFKAFVPIPSISFVTPIVENWTNYSFFLDRPIVPRGVENMPNPDQYTRTTSEAAKLAGQLLNYSPAKIENVIRGYFAGLGQYVMNGLDKALVGTGVVTKPVEPSPELADLPGIKGFAVRNPEGSGSVSVETFYKRRDEATKAYNKVRELAAQGDSEAVRAYIAEHPEVKMYKIYNKVANNMSTLRKARDAVYDSETMTPEEKRKKIDQINSLITRYAYNATHMTLE